MRQRVLIIGAGELGSAIAHVLKKQRPEVIVELWDKDASKVAGQRELKETVPAAEVVFLCVPSWSLREAAEQGRGLIKDAVPVVTMAKGLEDKTGKNSVEVLAEVFPDNPIVFVGGPMLAEEMVNGMMAVGMAGCAETEAAREIQELLRGKLLRIEVTADAQGVAYAGVLKNTYAIIMGLMCHLYPGSNMKGWLVARSLREMRLCGRILGVQDEVITGVAGLGDLVTTGFSQYSSNCLAGQELAVQGKTGVHSEGLASLPTLLQKIHPAGLKDLPLLMALQEVAVNKQEAVKVFELAFKQ
jgi:glycerol-3-phosphate dehydrogenase (NAD(P)+)